jgi:hypothetical protein
MMLLAPTFLEREVAPELVMKLRRRVSSHIETATPRGTVFRKGGDQHRPVGAYDPAHLRDVPHSVDRIGQKMKYGAIMPEVS